MIQEANQQETVTDREIGYLAAMIEGEGTVAVNLREKHWNGWNGWGVDMTISISNTDEAIVQKCAGILRKIGINPYIHKYERKEPWKDCWQVRTSKLAQVAKLLPLVIPDLAGEKKRKSEMLLAFVERRMGRIGQRSKKGGASWYDEADYKAVFAIYDSMGKSLPNGFLRDYTHSFPRGNEDIVRSA